MIERVEMSRNWVGKMPEGFKACGEAMLSKQQVKKSCSR